jgi:hypothetical protein
MAHTINDPVITVTIGVTEHDWTEDVASATFTAQKPTVSRPTFGSAGQKRNVKGLWDGSLTLDFNHDYATGEITQALWGALASDTPVTVKVRAKDAVISTSNPEWVVEAAVEELPTVDGAAGELATASVTFNFHGVPEIVTVPSS